MSSLVRILEDGPGSPRIEGSRINVTDVFYYLHRGYGWDVVHSVMPSLRRNEFDAVVEYVERHREKLIEIDNRIEERNRREMAEQEANGIRRPIDYSIPFEVRIARMRDRVRKQIEQRAEQDCDPCLIVG